MLFRSKLFNQHERVVCERVFLPAKQDLDARRGGAPSLVTLESGTPVAEFDIFAFSVSFEWDYTNVVTMLRLAGLKPRAAQPFGASHAHQADADKSRWC